MNLASLHIYPIKSTAPTDLPRAVVEPWGLHGDRRWLVVDPDGVQMTARERRRLLTARAHVGDAAQRLTVTGPHAPELHLDGYALAGPRTTAEVWDTRFAVVDAGDAAAAWFSALLDEEARLVFLDDPKARPVTHRAGRPGEVVSMADSYPLLLANTASLDQVNDWIAADHPGDGLDRLPMQRFRPNLVISGAPAFAEDGWTGVRVGEVTFRVSAPSSRCVLTTIDPSTLASGKEPIRSLARHHSWDQKTYFGVNLVPAGEGEIAVDDAVEILG